MKDDGIDPWTVKKAEEARRHCIALDCIVVHHITLQYITLHYITLHYIVLHCIVLHCIALYCIVLYGSTCTAKEVSGRRRESAPQSRKAPFGNREANARRLGFGCACEAGARRGRRDRTPRRANARARRGAARRFGLFVRARRRGGRAALDDDDATTAARRPDPDPPLSFYLCLPSAVTHNFSAFCRDDSWRSSVGRCSARAT